MDAGDPGTSAYGDYRPVVFDLGLLAQGSDKGKKSISFFQGGKFFTGLAYYLKDDADQSLFPVKIGNG